MAQRPMVSGEIRLGDRSLAVASPRDALEAGIAYLTEDRKALGLFLDMSCLANINLGVIGRDAAFGVVLDRDKARSRADEAFASLRIRAAGPSINVGTLSGGNQRKVLL